MIALCHYGGDLVFAKDGTVSYAGGEAIALPIEVMDFSVFKAELANRFHLSVEDVLLKYLYRGIISTLVTLSSDKDLKFLNVLVGADGVAVIFANIVNHGPSFSHTVASNPVTVHQPEKSSICGTHNINISAHGLSLVEYHKILVDKGFFTEALRVSNTHPRIEILIDKFVPQLEQMLLAPNPDLGENGVEFLSKFKTTHLAGCGFGEVLLSSYDELLNTVKRGDVHWLEFTLLVVKRTLIAAKDQLNTYKMIEENDKEVKAVSDMKESPMEELPCSTTGYKPPKRKNKKR